MSIKEIHVPCPYGGDIFGKVDTNKPGLVHLQCAYCFRAIAMYFDTHGWNGRKFRADVTGRCDNVPDPDTGGLSSIRFGWHLSQNGNGKMRMTPFVPDLNDR